MHLASQKLEFNAAFNFQQPLLLPITQAEKTEVQEENICQTQIPSFRRRYWGRHYVYVCFDPKFYDLPLCYCQCWAEVRKLKPRLLIPMQIFSTYIRLTSL